MSTSGRPTRAGRVKAGRPRSTLMPAHAPTTIPIAPMAARTFCHQVKSAFRAPPTSRRNMRVKTGNVRVKTSSVAL